MFTHTRGSILSSSFYDCIYGFLPSVFCFWKKSFYLLFSCCLCPHKHTRISWPAEPCKEVWTGGVKRRRAIERERDGQRSSSGRAGRKAGFWNCQFPRPDRVSTHKTKPQLTPFLTPSSQRWANTCDSWDKRVVTHSWRAYAADSSEDCYYKQLAEFSWKDKKCLKLRCVPTVKVLRSNDKCMHACIFACAAFLFFSSLMLSQHILLILPGLTLSGSRCPWDIITNSTDNPAGFYTISSNCLTPQLPNTPPVPSSLHSCTWRKANHRCDLPLFTSDPPQH